MRIFKRIWPGIVIMAMAAVLGGCGGGNGGGVTPAPVNQFAGTYSGTFSGTSAPGPIAGSFTATVDNSGNLTGTVTQNGTTFPATGSVDPNTGAVAITAGPPAGAANPFTSTLTGTATNQPGGPIVIGTFSTTRPGVIGPVATGRFTAIRAGVIANPFQGSYTGSFNGTAQSGAAVTGTFTANIDANGSGLAVVTQPGIGTYSASAIITRNGQVTIFAVGNGFVSTLTGTATQQNQNVTASGNFTTTSTVNGQTVVTGTFTATRTNSP